VGAGRVELTGKAHGAERERESAQATAQYLAIQVRKTEREERRARAKGTSADNLAPLRS
jgi:hypothetical protein